MKSGSSVAPLVAELISDEEFEHFRTLLRDMAGISLGAGKNALVESRLRTRLESTGLSDYRSYRDFLTSLPPGNPEWQIFINLLTTNKTDFFREPQHFDFLVSSILPTWLAKNEQVFRAWTCATSTGEEPYTLAMVLKRHLPAGKTFEILATDIDTDVLNTASNAVYKTAKLHEIPEAYQKDGVDLGRREVDGWFRIKQDLRSQVTFAMHNLIDESLPSETAFDLILCRNVMIYFARDTIRSVAAKLFAAAKPKSHLFIGHSETLHGLQQPWTSVQSAIYQRHN